MDNRLNFIGGKSSASGVPRNRYTGWSELIPSGAGLLAFRDEAEAAAALREVERDHARHARAAAELAATHFDHRVVLGDLLARANIPRP